MAEPLFVLAGDADATLAGLRGKHLRTAEEVRSAFVGNRRACWIASRSVLRLLRDGGSETHDTWHRLVTPDELDTPRRELLGALFRVVVAPGGGTRVLPVDQIKDVLTAEHRRTTSSAAWSTKKIDPWCCTVATWSGLWFRSPGSCTVAAAPSPTSPTSR